MKDVKCKYCGKVNSHYSFQCSRKPPKKVGDIEEMSYEEYKAKRSSVSKVKKKPIKCISDKQKERLKQYRIVRDAYMKLHPVCQAQLDCCTQVATDLHHMKDRCGSNLTDTNYFKAVCRSCHTFITEHSDIAKELGLSFNRLDK